MTKADLAEELFLKGYGCSQSILGAFADVTKLDMSASLKIASGFGGGMGRLREVCGAVTGAFMVIGLLYGFDSPDHNAKKELYEKIQAVANQFKEINGTIVCRELLSLNVQSQIATPDRRTEEYYKRRPCLRHIREMADILENYIQNNPVEKGNEQ